MQVRRERDDKFKWRKDKILLREEKRQKRVQENVYSRYKQVGLSPPIYSTGPQLSSPQSTVVRPQFVKCDEVALVKCHVELKQVSKLTGNQQLSFDPFVLMAFPGQG